MERPGIKSGKRKLKQYVTNKAIQATGSLSSEAMEAVRQPSPTQSHEKKDTVKKSSIHRAILQKRRQRHPQIS